MLRKAMFFAGAMLLASSTGALADDGNCWYFGCEEEFTDPEWQNAPVGAQGALTTCNSDTRVQIIRVYIKQPDGKWKVTQYHIEQLTACDPLG
jgi:hypothetical protein